MKKCGAFENVRDEGSMAFEAAEGVLGGGDLAHRAAAHQNDEIGDLANSFNTMAASLDMYIRDLTTVTAGKERIGAELDMART